MLLCYNHKDLLYVIQVYGLKYILLLSQSFFHTYRNLKSNFCTNHNHSRNNEKDSPYLCSFQFNIHHNVQCLLLNYTYKGHYYTTWVYDYLSICIKVDWVKFHEQISHHLNHPSRFKFRVILWKNHHVFLRLLLRIKSLYKVR